MNVKNILIFSFVTAFFCFFMIGTKDANYYYYKGKNGLEENHREEAVQWLTKASEMGCAKATQLLASMFQQEGNAVEALNLLARVVKAERDSNVMQFINICFETGELLKGKEILQPLADEGNSSAQYGIGFIYLAEKQFDRAVVHFAAASSKNYAHATLSLSECYSKGLGVPKDLDRALELCELAKIQDNSLESVVEEVINVYKTMI